MKRKMLLHELSPFVRHCGEFDLPPGFHRAPYSIPEHEFIHVLSGTAKYKIGPRIYPLAPGDLLLVPPGVMTQSWNKSDTPMYFQAVHFDFRFHGDYDALPIRFPTPSRASASRVHATPDTVPPLRLPRKVRVAKYPQVRLLLDRIIREVAEKPPAYELAVKACLLELLALLHRRRWAASGESPASSETVRHATEFLESNYARPLRLADVAGAAHLSPIYFERVFKKATGFTPMAYLARVRTDRAKRLLLDNDLKMAQVAFAVGFEDPHYFSRVFHKIEGVSPNDYRRFARGLEGIVHSESPKQRGRWGPSVGAHFTIAPRES